MYSLNEMAAFIRLFHFLSQQKKRLASHQDTQTLIY